MGRVRKLPLWEERWDKAALLAKRQMMTAQAFDRGFRQRPFSDEDRTFSPIHIAEATKGYLSLEETRKWTGMCYTGVDLSGTKRPGVSFFTTKFFHKESRYIRVPIDIRVGTFKGNELVHQFADIEARFRPQIYMVENNSLQERIVDMLKIMPVTSNLPIVGYHTGKQKTEEEHGLPSLSVEFQNGLWVIPWMGCGRRGEPPDGHSVTCQCAWCRWYYDELLLHPMAESTDILMAQWFSREAWRLYGQKFEYFEVIEGPSIRGAFHL